MRAVVQRVKEAKVTVQNKEVGKITKGFLVLLGVSEKDTSSDVEYMVDKLVHLRVFEDEDDKMNVSLKDTKGQLLIVSNFTLYGDCRKGRRPNFMQAAKPDKAKQLYEEVIAKCKEKGIVVQTGEFQAMMDVSLTNDGPVTILLDSERQF